MTREQIKKWLPEMTAYSEGKDILIYYYADNTWYEAETPSFNINSIYVINDKHVEARKAFTLGEPVEIRYRYDKEFQFVTNPIWNDDCEYRPKKIK